MSKRRTFSLEFKAQRVLEVLTGAKTATEICREHLLKADLASRWKLNFLQHAANVFQGDEEIDPAQARIAELERLVGRLTREREVAKKVSKLSKAPSSRNEL